MGTLSARPLALGRGSVWARMLEGVGKGRDLWHFPSSWKQGRFLCPDQQSVHPPSGGAEGNPAGLWPHPATGVSFKQSLSQPPCTRRTPPSLETPSLYKYQALPIGNDSLAPQTLSSTAARIPLVPLKSLAGPISPLLGNSAHPHSSKLRPCFCLEWSKASMPWELLWRHKLSQTCRASSCPEFQRSILPNKISGLFFPFSALPCQSSV